MRARLALAVSGQVVELREVDLKDKPAEILQVSSKGSVPVLVGSDGKVLEESLDIMLWALRQNDPARWLEPETGGLVDMLALIARCDSDFKFHLDRYKYPDRYADTDVLEHRAASAIFLAELNTRMGTQTYLFGHRPALADMAIAPFVRQFAQTDRGWFEQQDWPAIRVWLGEIINSTDFTRIMTRHPKWTSGAAPVRFPE